MEADKQHIFSPNDRSNVLLLLSYLLNFQLSYWVSNDYDFQNEFWMKVTVQIIELWA